MNEISDSQYKFKWLWFFGGAVYGVFLRYLFDVLPSSVEGPMSVAFLIGTPFVVGALTIYGYKDQRLRLSKLLLLPWISTFLMLVGTAVALFEGAICIAIMTPLFLFCSSVGGLLMGGCLYLIKSKTKPLLSVALLPYLIFFYESNLSLAERNIQIVESVVVQASPEVIWKEIMTAKAIRPEELPLSITHLIGVPKPLEGVNITEDAVEVRYSFWEKGVNFKAVVQERKVNQFIKWKYLFDAGSFPKGSMDDHVAIGGRYFDLHDTSFTLTPLKDNNTQLTIHASYRVSSAINFYAVPISKLLGVDFVRTILGLYKHRSEAVH